MVTIRVDQDRREIVEVEGMLDDWADEQIAAGKMVHGAKADLKAHAQRFGFIEGAEESRLVDTKTGIDWKVTCDDMLKQKLHWQPTTYTDDEEQAFGDHPTMKARGDYLKKYGEEKYQLERDRWGASDHNLKPGRRPLVGEDKTTKKPSVLTDGRLNPFLNLRDRTTGKLNEKLQQQIADAIKAKGIAVVSKWAKDAGVTLGGVPIAERFR